MSNGCFPVSQSKLEITVYKATMSREVPQQIFQLAGKAIKKTNPRQKRLISRHGLRLKSVSTGPAKHRVCRDLFLSKYRQYFDACQSCNEPKEKMKIKISNKGTVINAKEYNRIRTDKIKEMREGTEGAWARWGPLIPII